MTIRTGFIVLLLVALAGCGENAVENGPAADPPAVPEVVTATLQSRNWQGTLRSFGAVEALEEVDVAAELSGTVLKVHVNEGDTVLAGQLLLELDAEKRRLALAQAQEAAQQARTALEEAQLRLQRRRNLAERETISREVLDNAQLAVESARAAYQQSQAALQLARRELQDTRITSPTDGLVDVRAVEPGEAVQAGVSLIKLQAVSDLRVQTWVSEADILYLRAASPARVFPSGMPGRSFDARVEWVGVNADPRTGNFPVKLILEPGADTLRPGMTVTAQVQGLEVPDALLLPERALVDRDRRRVVFVVQDGIARQREPLLAAGLSDALIVLAGLEAGDSVVVEGQQRLIDGTAVRTRSAD